MRGRLICPFLLFYTRELARILTVCKSGALNLGERGVKESLIPNVLLVADFKILIFPLNFNSLTVKKPELHAP